MAAPAPELHNVCAMRLSCPAMAIIAEKTDLTSRYLGQNGSSLAAMLEQTGGVRPSTDLQPNCSKQSRRLVCAVRAAIDKNWTLRWPRRRHHAVRFLLFVNRPAPAYGLPYQNPAL